MAVAAAETIIAWQGHEGPRVARARGYDIIACDLCGFRHVAPLPDAPARPWPDAGEAEGPAAEREWAELAFADRAETFARLLGPGRRRLLDAAAGNGDFLKFIKGLGWNGLGIEPSRPAAAQARAAGLEVLEGAFDARMTAGLGRFDTVNLAGLAAAPNPIELLVLARGLLEPGGVLCVTVPNDFSPLQIAAAQALRAEDWWIAPPQHLNYFDFESLAALLERLGFDVAERTTGFPMETFLLMGENHLRDPALARAAEGKRRRFDLALEQAGFRETRREFYRALAQAGLGRDVILFARAP